MGTKRPERSKSSSKSPRNESRKYKKRRRKNSTSPPAPSGRELLIAASLGDYRQCKQLLRQGADVNWSDGDLTTSLHAASRAGNLKIVQLLLRNGANASLQDVKGGNTAAHLAAKTFHLEVVSALLRSRTIGNALTEPNDKGETVESLIAKAMEQQETQAKLAAEQHKREEAGGGDGSKYFPKESELDWEERLRRELSPGEEDAYYYDHSTWQADQFETAEEYAKRIWIEMEGRKKLNEEKERRKTAFADAKSSSREKEKQEDKQKKEAAEKKQRKQQQEEEEEARWRAAKAAGSGSLKRASYEARWEFFCTKNKIKRATFADIPWILAPTSLDTANSAKTLKTIDTSNTANFLLHEIENVLLHNAESTDQQRQILRRELIRWHPDKFIGKFGALLDPGDKDTILDAVNETSQLLTLLLAKTAQR